MSNICLLLKTGNIRSPRCRLVWPHVFKPKKDDDGKEKYQISLIIPKGSDLDLLKKDASEKFAAMFGKDAKPAASPFKNTADKERLVDYADDFPIFIDASRNLGNGPPEVTTTRKDPNTGKLEKIGSDRQSEVYGGRWVYVSLNAYAWSFKSRKGVSIGLNNIQLLEDDDPIGGGRVAASSEFEAVEELEGGEGARDASSMF
jgi:hypothetical protein